MMIKEGSKVTGIYYNTPYEGTIRKARSYMGNDKTLFPFNIYYINLDKPITQHNQELTNICLDGMSQKLKYVTIGVLNTPKLNSF